MSSRRVRDERGSTRPSPAVSRARCATVRSSVSIAASSASSGAWALGSNDDHASRRLDASQQIPWAAILDRRVVHPARPAPRRAQRRGLAVRALRGSPGCPHSVRRPTRDASARGAEVALGLLEQSRREMGRGHVRGGSPLVSPGGLPQQPAAPAPGRRTGARPDQPSRTRSSPRSSSRPARAHRRRPPRARPRRRSDPPADRPGPPRAARGAPGTTIVGAEQVVCQARRVARTIDVAGRETVRAASNAVSATSVTLPPASIAASAVSASRRASSTRFAEQQNRRPVGARDCQLLHIPELGKPLLGVPQRRERSSGRCPRGRTGSRDSALRSRRDAHARWHRLTDRLAQVLGAFVDASSLGTQQAEVGVGSSGSRLVTGRRPARRAPSDTPSRPHRGDRDGGAAMLAAERGGRDRAPSR